MEFLSVTGELLKGFGENCLLFALTLLMAIPLGLLVSMGSMTKIMPTAAVIAFVVNYSAYFSEIFRGGIEAIPKGQYEAGQVLGMSKTQIFRKIVLMQVIKRITAPMSNEIITLVKDTSLARVIMVPEMLKAAERFTMQGLIWPLFYTGVFFLIFCGVLTLLFRKLEKKLDYYKI